MITCADLKATILEHGYDLDQDDNLLTVTLPGRERRFSAVRIRVEGCYGLALVEFVHPKRVERRGHYTMHMGLPGDGGILDLLMELTKYLGKVPPKKSTTTLLNELINDLFAKVPCADDHFALDTDRSWNHFKEGAVSVPVVRYDEDGEVEACYDVHLTLKERR